MSLIRVLRTAAATLTRTFYVDETATDSSTVVTVAVTRLDGTAVSSGNAQDLAGTGVYGYTLPGQAQLDQLLVSWTATIGGGTITVTDDVEIVGGFFFGLAEARASDTSLSDLVKYPTATLAAARLEVEQACEEMCYRAFVPRYRRARLNGSGGDTLIVPDPDLRSLRSAAITWVQGGDLAALTGESLTRIQPTPEGLLIRPNGLPWPYGRGTVLVEYEHGLGMPPLEVKRMALRHLRAVVLAKTAGIPDRATSFTVADGGTYRLATPGRRSTGIPDVDAVYQRYAAAPAGFA